MYILSIQKYIYVRLNIAEDIYHAQTQKYYEEVLSSFQNENYRSTVTMLLYLLYLYITRVIDRLRQFKLYCKGCVYSMKKSIDYSLKGELSGFSVCRKLVIVEREQGLPTYKL